MFDNFVTTPPKPGITARLITLGRQWRLHHQYAMALYAAAAIAGLATYFQLEFNPGTLMIAAAGAATVLGFHGARRFIDHRRLLLQLAAFFAGAFVYAHLYVEVVNTPLVHKSDYVAGLVGDVKEVSLTRDGGVRLQIQLTADSPGPVPGGLLDLRQRTDANTIRPGDTVAFDAVVFPNPGAIRPDGYNTQVAAYMRGVSGTGFITTEIVKLPRDQPRAAVFASLRGAIDRRFQAQLAEGDAAALASALVTGNRAGLSKEAGNAMRRAGLSHLLAISGLHMGIIAMGTYFILELLCLLLLPVRLQNLVRPIAGAIAVAVAFIYLGLAGATPPTQRAVFMVTVVLLALTLHRTVLSFRSVILAAFVVMVLDPSAVLGAGFTLSFAATSVLVLAFEQGWARPWYLDKSERRQLNGLSRYILGGLWITFLAQAAIAPFAFYYFQSVSVVVFAANIVAVPLVTFLVLPLLVISVLLMPLGLDVWFSGLLQTALELLLTIASVASDTPMAAVNLPAPHPMALPVAAAALLGFWLVRPAFAENGWLALKTGLWMGLGGIIVTAAIAAFPGERAFAFLSGARPNLAYQEGGHIHLYGLRKDSFRTQSWRRYWGIEPDDEAIRVKPGCDADGCRIMLPDGQAMAMPLTIPAFQEDCGRPQLVIVPRGLLRRSPYQHCANLHRDVRFLYLSEIEREGPFGLYLDEGGNLFARASKEVSSRPWHPRVQDWQDEEGLGSSGAKVSAD